MKSSSSCSCFPRLYFNLDSVCNRKEVTMEMVNMHEKQQFMNGSHATVKRTLGGLRHSSKVTLLPSAASEVIEISDSDDEGKPGGTTYISVTSFGDNTRREE